MQICRGGGSLIAGCPLFFGNFLCNLAIASFLARALVGIPFDPLLQKVGGARGRHEGVYILGLVDATRILRMPHLQQVWLRLTLAYIRHSSRIAVIVTMPHSLAALDDAPVTQIVIVRVAVANMTKYVILLCLRPLVHKAVILALVGLGFDHVVLDNYGRHTIAATVVALSCTATNHLVVSLACNEAALIRRSESRGTEKLA